MQSQSKLIQSVPQKELLLSKIKSNKNQIQINYYEIQPTKETIKTNLIKINTLLIFSIKRNINITITKLNYPYLNSSIFSQYLLHNSDSSTYIQLIDSIKKSVCFENNTIPAFLSGIKISIAGRLTSEAIIPRKTMNCVIIGTKSTCIEFSKFSTKNKIGTYTIKVYLYIKSLQLDKTQVQQN